MFIFFYPLAFCQLSGEKTSHINALLLEKQNEFRREIEDKIKNYILDPILGKNKAYVVADVMFSVVAKKQEQTKEGIGVLQQYKEKGAGQSFAETDFILPGIPKPKAILGDNLRRPEAAHGAQTQQTKGIEEIMFWVEPQITRFQVTVFHDETLPQELLLIARQRIDDLLVPYKVNQKDPPLVIFKPTRFKKTDIWDDLKKPMVYLPLLYALLFLLLLLYLFGPLWSFLRKYLRALLAKPGAEVKIEDKREEGGGKGKGEGEEKQESHQEIDMRFIQKEEEPPLPPEEEEMKKFEPFSYINEENIKRLVYLFLLRKEDPWIIAVVLSYLRPELAKQAFAMLPLELQSRVAIESLKVKQATREQIEAIDKDIKENVEFVMGGIEQLMRILEEADAQTRKNVLEYLKSQKPDIYDKIKAVMLSFEDLINFTDKDIQTVIRNTSQEDIAKALKNASPEIVEKFFKNMSAGARESIKEVMEYMGEVTPQQSDEAQMRILDTVKALEAEGKISSYRRNEQGLIYILDSGDVAAINRQQKVEKVLDSFKQVEEYLNAGVEAYNNQEFDKAEEYLRYVVEADPNNSTAWQYLGSVYYALQRYNEAVGAYQRYVDLTSDREFARWLEEFKKSLGM